MNELEVTLRKITKERDEWKAKAEAMAKGFNQNINELKLGLKFAKQD